MFEGIVCGFIVFAIGYVGLMRVMARRADVLHGEFIQQEGPNSAPEPSMLTAFERYLDGSRLLAKR